MKTTLALLCLLTFAPAASAADKPKADAKTPPPMDEATKKMIEYGTPAAEHARLKPLAGSWSVKSKMWMKPGDAPQESAGSSYYSWILDGRWLRDDFKGDMGGMVFVGLGHHGFDKVRGEYVSTWMDSMSTGFATSHGSYDAKTNVLSETGSYADPATGQKDRWFRTEWKFPSGVEGSTMTFSMWNKDEKGAEYKTMEMVYTRTK
jgi:hypothetical protein